MRPKIAIFGSINMDLVIECHKLPQPGETILASSAREVPGGKGANQAVGAARLGAEVHMAGRVGDDAFANQLIANLEAEGIQCAEVRRVEHCSSGVAIVAVEQSGENAIMVVPGANHRLLPETIEQLPTAFASCNVALLQLEIPIPTAIAAIQWAKRNSIPVILNPAPIAIPFDPRLFGVDILCPNQTEAEALLERKIDSIEAASKAAEELVRRGAAAAIITLGDQGAVVSDGAETRHIPPFSIVPVDTTAAGDAFAAGLAYQIGQGQSLWSAVEFGCAAGAVAATRAGAQPGMPTLDDAIQMLNNRN